MNKKKFGFERHHSTCVNQEGSSPVAYNNEHPDSHDHVSLSTPAKGAQEAILLTLP